MSNLASIGQKRTILISISILLVSLHTIYYYHSIRPEIDFVKLRQQILRFALTALLLYQTYAGKKWARGLFLLLFVLAIILAVQGILNPDIQVPNKIPMVVMVLVYGVGIFHFGFSKSFKAYIDHISKDKN